MATVNIPLRESSSVLNDSRVKPWISSMLAVMQSDGNVLRSFFLTMYPLMLPYVRHSRTLLGIGFFLLCFLRATASPTSTLEVTYGTTNQSEPNALCGPATQIDIATFFLFNYVAHGATIVSYPGESALDKLFCVVVAIFLPGMGVIRALNLIMRHPVVTSNNDLDIAARSGALCMLVRSSSWRPQRGDNVTNALTRNTANLGHNIPTVSVKIYPYSRPIKFIKHFSHRSASLSVYTPPWLVDATRFWQYQDTADVDIGSRLVFGLNKPPDQYAFVFVPRNTTVLELTNLPPTPFPNIHPLLRPVYHIFASPISTPKLASSFNLARGVAALIQLLYASFTLYRASGGQIRQYGFVAPGLTVLPYIIMSVLNLTANFLAPHYPTLYLVRSEVMAEAEQRMGSSFNYVVGRIVDESDTVTNVIPEGWSEIAGSFGDEGKLHCISSTREGEEIEIDDRSDQTIYVPSCPRFRRTGDARSQPSLRKIIEKSSPRRLSFPVYTGHSSRTLKLLSRLECFLGNAGFHVYETSVVMLIIFAQMFVMHAAYHIKIQNTPQYSCTDRLGCCMACLFLWRLLYLQRMAQEVESQDIHHHTYF